MIGDSGDVDTSAGEPHEGNGDSGRDSGNGGTSRETPSRDRERTSEKPTNTPAAKKDDSSSPSAMREGGEPPDRRQREREPAKETAKLRLGGLRQDSMNLSESFQLEKVPAKEQAGFKGPLDGDPSVSIRTGMKVTAQLGLVAQHSVEASIYTDPMLFDGQGGQCLEVTFAAGGDTNILATGASATVFASISAPVKSLRVPLGPLDAVGITGSYGPVSVKVASEDGGRCAALEVGVGPSINLASAIKALEQLAGRVGHVSANIALVNRSHSWCVPVRPPGTTRRPGEW